MLQDRCALNRAWVSKAGLLLPHMAFAVLVALSVLLPAPPAAAQQTTTEFNIPAQPISSALRAYAQQAKVQLIVLTEGLNLVESNAVVGRMAPREALQMLLDGTHLRPEYRADGTVAVKRGANPAGIHRIQTETGDGKDEIKPYLEEIVVTGTNIRGIAPESSPVRVFDRQVVQISGAATAQDFIKTLPQNFGGGSNISHIEGLPDDDSTAFNMPLYGGAGGASVNLHGLGSGATLVLLNGHRVAPSSGIGDFVDIAMIPASALERVELLTDGASSIYGGDAVAGVVNFILRDDFDGVETSLRYGTVTEGNLDQYRTNFTGGEVWSTGNALVVYEYFSQDELSAGDRSFSQSAPLPNGLLPDQKRHSILASVSQNMTPDLELFADLIFSERKTVLDSTGALDNTYLSTSKSDSWNISTGGSWAASNEWTFDTSLTYSNTKTDGEYESTTALIRRAVDSKLWAMDAKTSGTVLRLPGGELKLAFGGHYRSEAFSNVLSAGTGRERKADRDVYALFGELHIPIVGPAQMLPGIDRFEINASGRFADYSDFGSVANPKIGVLWSAVDGLNLRVSYSASFNPPPLGRVGALDRSVVVYPSLLINNFLGLTPGDPSIADVDILSVSGTSKNLHAEESKAFTAGVDLDRKWSTHRLSANATYFDIRFDGRLGDTPVPDGSDLFNVPNIAFNHPEVFPAGTVIFFPSLDQINDVLDSSNLPINSPFGSDPLNASVIHFTNVVRNLSQTFVRGIDFDATYSFDSVRGRGELVLGLAGTYFIDFEQQAAVTTPVVEQLNTLFNPLDLRLRGSVGYADDDFTANLFLNYTTDYRVDKRPGAAQIDSWATVDLSLAYDTRQRFGESVFSGTIVRLSVINLLDRDPPSVPVDSSYNVLGYDPSNASPLGRFVALELTKRF